MLLRTVCPQFPASFIICVIEPQYRVFSALKEKLSAVQNTVYQSTSTKHRLAIKKKKVFFDLTNHTPLSVYQYEHTITHMRLDTLPHSLLVPPTLNLAMA